MTDEPRVSTGTESRWGRHCCVLVVEDDSDILVAVQDLLEFEGFRVDCAQTCHDAFSSIERNVYDAVLLDLSLPDGDGHSILEKIQATDPSPPVIVLTATTSMEQKFRALARGAFAFLTKPYDRAELCACLHRAIELNGCESAGVIERRSTLPGTIEA